ncbi:MAG: DUF502 domain-containing protein [Pseudomonadota bacterium]
MRAVRGILLKGLAAVLPVGLTVYIVYWLGVSVERLFHPIITSTGISEEHYIPGMGVLTGFLLLFLVGLVVNAWIVRRMFQFGEDLLERIPLIKSVYGALRDFMDYFSTADQRSELEQVVLVKIGEARLLGFLTAENLEDLPLSLSEDDNVAVYLPLSYQIGGYTIYIPRSNIEPVNMDFEYAMRHVLTAGLAKTGAGKHVKPD